MDRTEEILKYLNHDLTGEERNKFEKELENDQNMKTKLNEIESIIRAVQLSGEEHLRHDLQLYLEEYRRNNPKGKIVSLFKNYYLIGGIAASLLIGVMIWIYSGTTPSGPVNWQMEEAPIHADSATYNEADSTRVKDSTEVLTKPE